MSSASTSLKRKFNDGYDTPVSSTPPRPPKRAEIAPSDSPTNPFRHLSSSSSSPSRYLPRASCSTDHLMLRFQLVSEDRNVFRVVQVPDNYTFWHLRHLTSFLFGWRKNVSRRLVTSGTYKVKKADSLIEVKTNVVMDTTKEKVGIVKGGTSIYYGASDDSKWLKGKNVRQETKLFIRDVWPDDLKAESKALVFYADKPVAHNHRVHITWVPPSKLALQVHKCLTNLPYVVLGTGLPDDDEDDDDFVLDLEQWNASDAFLNFIEHELEETEDTSSATRLTPEERSFRIDEEHDKIKALTSKGMGQMATALQKPDHQDVFQEPEVPAKAAVPVKSQKPVKQPPARAKTVKEVKEEMLAAIAGPRPVKRKKASRAADDPFLDE